MKIGAENKTKVIAMVVLMAVLAVVLFYELKGYVWNNSAAAAPSISPAVTPAPVKPAGSVSSQVDDTNSRLLLDVLDNSRRIKYQEGRNIFSMEALPPPTPLTSVRQTPTPPPIPTPPPTPPPFPLKYYGFANKPGEPRKIFLQENGGEVFVASQGQIVARRYRVTQIQPNTVTMEDVITGEQQSIQLSVR